MTNIIRPLLSIKDFIVSLSRSRNNMSSLTAIDCNFEDYDYHQNQEDFSDFIEYQNDFIFYYARKCSEKDIFNIEHHITFKNVQTIAYLTYLGYSVLESYYSPVKNTRTVLQNCVMMLEKVVPPAVTIGYLVITNYVEKRLPVKVKKL